ncbi:N-acetylneuraminate synthase family protein [Alkalilimnicola sp. S0819]|uniref:N-acetylneuraminate synthase family protein n=1 Tax=Alkalilimnicola sp. S0819 TaxID=2613922 RepID=UPI0012613B2A|nr:N-acetylneuraminate synthase family protein [Alkalilimnicola sp. S0819]KAB7628235.1 polysaccharide biosynthesis protein [Alkalilimnicola sp. S0819]MPQ15126.1 polysaccharide biosynthesis protein [Alkalilimnicola sp. S0819]
MELQLTKDFRISAGGAPYVIAEIGANHNGDLNLAKEMVAAAKACGAHAAKFQSWTPESLISESEYQSNQVYTDSPKKHFGSLRSMVEKYYLTEDQHRELKAYCDTIGIDFCSSPFSREEVDLLADLGVEFFKIASMDINNLDLLGYAASFQKPIILSTGMATLGEIETAIETIRAQGNDRIIPLHCISIYPPEYADINLNNIPTLQQAFGYPVGFSDHTIGFSVPLAAVALGACVIEKHFTTDKDLPGWDHEISADPEEMRIICAESRNIALSLGSHRRTVSPAEEQKKLKFRRSVVARHALEAGHVLTADDLAFKRPATGIPPNEAKYLIGRTLKQALDGDAILSWQDLV